MQSKYTLLEISSLISTENKTYEQIYTDFVIILTNQNRFELLYDHLKTKIFSCIYNRQPSVNLFDRRNVNESVDLLKSLSIYYAVLTRDWFLYAILLSSTYKNMTNKQKTELSNFIQSQNSQEHEKKILNSMSELLNFDTSKLPDIFNTILTLPATDQPYKFNHSLTSIPLIFLITNFESKIKFTQLSTDSLIMMLCKSKMDGKPLSEYLSFDITTNELNNFISKSNLSKLKSNFYYKAINHNLINRYTLKTIIELILDPIISDARIIELTTLEAGDFYEFLLCSNEPKSWKEINYVISDADFYRKLQDEEKMYSQALKILKSKTQKK